ncbi:MAG: DUF420 domain-containing protein [Bacteroidetes bacterium]|jgi:putative membrane protein|nr:DUF420 domain-containing protein [Bacteroidota bacterium]
MTKLLLGEKTIFRIVTAVTAIVLLLVLFLNRRVFPRPDATPEIIYVLPLMNAFINATCFILLLVSFYFIRKKRIDLHKKINLTAFFLSAIFIVSYITYHYFAEETHFPKENPLRGFYLFILITHIILSAAVLPLVLLSFYYGLKMDVKKHKRITRFSLPIWLYVTLTGVIAYLMISPYYPHHF